MRDEIRKGRFAMLSRHSRRFSPGFAFRFGESSTGFRIPENSV
jgi:hypothetical protein